MRRPESRKRGTASILSGPSVLFLILLATSAAPGAAQLNLASQDGARVRITSSGYGLAQAVGVVRKGTDGNLFANFESPRTSIPLEPAAIQSLEVSIERRSHGAVGAILGTLAGGVIGFAIGVAGGDDEELRRDCYSDMGIVGLLSGTCEVAASAELRGVGMGLGMALLGGGLGFAVGHSIKTDVWAPAGLGRNKISIQPTLQLRGPGFTVGVSF